MLPSKPVLRAEMLARLQCILPDERRERSARLVARLIAREDWQRARTVGLFAPLPSEPDVDLLWTIPGALAGKRVVYPRVESGGLVLRAVTRPEELLALPGRGLREPPVGAPALSGWPDLLLVPGLAFTAAGGRLGRGGGFYDRLLRGAGGCEGCFTVGIGFSFQRLRDLPTEPHDAVLGEILTDGGDTTPDPHDR